MGHVAEHSDVINPNALPYVPVSRDERFRETEAKRKCERGVVNAENINTRMGNLCSRTVF